MSGAMEARLITVASFVFVIGLVIFVHELGHFLLAKRARIPIHAFALGFGPALLKLKRGETTYRLNVIPIGGYVHIAGMEPEDLDHPSGFNSKSAAWRVVILTGGAAMNVLLGFVVFCLIGMVWGVSTKVHTTIDRVIPGEGADKAGIKRGDRIIGVGDLFQVKRTTSLEEIRKYIASRPAGYVVLLLQRDAQTLQVRVDTSREVGLVPKEVAPSAPRVGYASSLEWTGHWFKINRLELVKQEVGRIGVVFASGSKRVGPLTAIGHGLISTVEMTGSVVLGLRSLLRRELPVKEAGYGPLGIATLVGEQAKTHFVNLLSILGMISINLAVINLVPFPALDGGRTAFVLLEVVLGWFRQKPVNRRTEAYIHLGGFVLLMMLLLALTANDVLRMVNAP